MGIHIQPTLGIIRPVDIRGGIKHNIGARGDTTENIVLETNTHSYYTNNIDCLLDP